jgi:hypothetical protein
MRDALDLTSDWMYRWRLLPEEYGPKVVYIKGIHNTIADAISWLGYDPSVNQTAESYFMTKVNKSSKRTQRQSWMAVSKYWCELELNTNKHEDLNLVFANHGEKDEMYLLTTKEIKKSQKKDQELKIYYKQNAKNTRKDIPFQIIEDTKVLCKDNNLNISASLRHRATSWYHH